MLVRTGPNKGQYTAKISEERSERLERLGVERVLIYWVAVTTGLRAGELRSVRVKDVSFGDVPFIRLQGKNAKNRKEATVSLRSDVAQSLQEWVKDRQPGDKLLNVPKTIRNIMDRDLEAAGIPKVDENGEVIHFHGLRHTFATQLSLSGVAPRVAQKLMRHSSIDLTMNTYTDTRMLQTSEALEAIPSIAPNVAPDFVPSCLNLSQSVANEGGGDLGDIANAKENPIKHGKRNRADWI